VLEEGFGFRYVFPDGDDNANEFVIYDPNQLAEASERNGDVWGESISDSVYDLEIQRLLGTFFEVIPPTPGDHRKLGILFGIPDTELESFIRITVLQGNFESEKGFRFPEPYDLLGSYVPIDESAISQKLQKYMVVHDRAIMEGNFHTIPHVIQEQQDMAELAEYRDFLMSVYRNHVLNLPTFTGDWEELAKMSILHGGARVNGVDFATFRSHGGLSASLDPAMNNRWRSLNEHFISTYLKPPNIAVGSILSDTSA